MSKRLMVVLLFVALPLYGDYIPIEVKKAGTIKGLVKFAEESPPRAMFGTRGDPNCPAGIPQEHLLVKQENRGIQNAIVTLKILKGKPFKLVQAKLDNQGCKFVPRIQWIPKGSSILLTNSDPTLHNFHALRDGNTIFNVDIPAKGAPVRRPIVDSGIYKINCDQHLWMRAWIYASDHPYVSISNAKGEFELTDVPPGAYELRVWHEGWIEAGYDKGGQLRFRPMEQILRVKVRANQVTEVLADVLEPTFL